MTILWDLKGDKSGAWVPYALPNTFYMGEREWVFEFEEMNLDGRSMAVSSSRVADKAIENMMAVRI